MGANDKYWNMEVEPLLNTAAMEKIQLKNLKKQLTQLKASAPFLSKTLKKVDPDKLKSFAEFKDKVPMFNKAEFVELVGNCGGDYSKALDQVMVVNCTDLDYISTTTGTSGVPAPYPMTNHDILNGWGELLARGSWRANIRSDDRVLFCFALSMVIAGVPTMLGMQQLGVTMLPIGAEAKSERILKTQELFRGNVYMGTPSLAEYLIDQAPLLINKNVGDLGFKALIMGGEPGAGIPEIKRKLEDAYGCQAYDVGAGFGFSCGCEQYQGMHSLADDICYYELVDPVTKEPIPFEHGAKGEAVFTTLNAKGWVMLRHSMGDIHQVFTEPCPCGQSGFRYKVTGRADDMLKVKGVMVYPTHIKGVINDFLPKVTGEHRIVLDEKPPRVVPPLKIMVEHGEGMGGEALAALESEIVEAMSRRIKIRPKIIWVEPGSLERSHYKGQVFEKLYEES